MVCVVWGEGGLGVEEEDLTWERWVWSVEAEGEDVAKTSHE